jgi:hypothetical protein
MKTFLAALAAAAAALSVSVGTCRRYAARRRERVGRRLDRIERWRLEAVSTAGPIK